MMKTEYRGYEIHYSENSDRWHCSDAGVAHEKLSKVKEAIDRMHLKLRKASSVACYRFGNGSRDFTAIEATIIDYIRPIKKALNFEGRGRETGPVIDHEVAIVAAHIYGFHGEKKSRQIVRLSELADAEVFHQVDAITEIERKIAALNEEKKAVIATIKTIPFEAIADLVRASEHRFSEEEAAKK